MTNRFIIYIIILITPLFKIHSGEECCGKVDLAPVYMCVNMIEDHKTVEKLHMWGGRFDGSFNIWKGILIKPTVMLGYGDGNLDAETLGLGVCWKANDYFTFIPNFGYSHSGLSTHLHPVELPGLSLKTKFQANGGFLGLDINLNLLQNFRIVTTIQYGFSATVTKIKYIGTHKGHSQGGNYALGLEYDINPCWSVNLVGGYNTSLSHEKDGTKVYGAKLGIVRWLYK